MNTAFRERLQATLGADYALERELGGGGMSRVFVAREASLGRRVVVKVLPPELTAGASAERFRREIHLAARLRHPHVVPVLAAGERGGLLYYTMPFVEGESLRGRLAREGAVPVAEAVKLLRELADALAHAHRTGVVHRDLKPENVLLEAGHAVVTDFGVAKALAAATEGGSGAAGGAGGGLTSVGFAVGTPAYMAPEQAAADPQTDHRADLYALGVVGYELLAGSHPFAGRPPQALLAAHAAEVPEPVTRRRAAVPEALAALVARLLEKHPGDRPQTAEEVLSGLEALVTPVGGTTRVPPGVTARAAGRAAQRTRWAAAALAALALAGVGGAVVARRGAGSAERSDAVAAPRARDWVLVAEVPGPPDDPGLGVAVRELVSAVVDQSGGLSTVPPDQLLAARRLAQLPDTAPLTGERARHLAYRTAVGTVVEGRVYRAGRAG